MLHDPVQVVSVNTLTNFTRSEALQHLWHLEHQQSFNHFSTHQYLRTSFKDLQNLCKNHIFWVVMGGCSHPVINMTRTWGDSSVNSMDSHGSHGTSSKRGKSLGSTRFTAIPLSPNLAMGSGCVVAHRNDALNQLIFGVEMGRV